MAAPPPIGRCACLLCGSSKARVGMSEKTQLTYITCNACNTQVFSRSGRSDELIRGRILGPMEPDADPAPAPVAPPTPTPTPTPANLTHNATPTPTQPRRKEWRLF